MVLTSDGWKSAGDFSEEDVLKTLGRDEKVVEVRRRKLESTAMVYNFSVMGCHTYAVGKTGAIVHNGCYYRGVNDFKATIQDMKINQGLVQTTLGVSLNKNLSVSHQDILKCR